MPQTARASQAGYSYHVLNRGNALSEVFHWPGDFSAFLHVIGESSVRLPMGLLAYWRSTRALNGVRSRSRAACASTQRVQPFLG